MSGLKARVNSCKLLTKTGLYKSSFVSSVEPRCSSDHSDFIGLDKKSNNEVL